MQNELLLERIKSRTSNVSLYSIHIHLLFLNLVYLQCGFLLLFPLSQLFGLTNVHFTYTCPLQITLYYMTYLFLVLIFTSFLQQTSPIVILLPLSLYSLKYIQGNSIYSFYFVHYWSHYYSTSYILIHFFLF